MLVMPKAEYVIWHGNRFEGRGVKPDLEVPWEPANVSLELDNQIQVACDALARLSVSKIRSASL